MSESLISYLEEEIQKIEANTNLLAAVKGAYDLLVSKVAALTGELQTMAASGNRTDINEVTQKFSALLAATDTETLAIKAIAGTQVDPTQEVAGPTPTGADTSTDATSDSNTDTSSSTDAAASEVEGVEEEPDTSSD